MPPCEVCGADKYTHVGPAEPHYLCRTHVQALLTFPWDMITSDEEWHAFYAAFMKAQGKEAPHQEVQAANSEEAADAGRMASHAAREEGQEAESPDVASAERSSR